MSHYLVLEWVIKQEIKLEVMIKDLVSIGIKQDKTIKQLSERIDKIKNYKKQKNANKF